VERPEKDEIGEEEQRLKLKIQEVMMEVGKNKDPLLDVHQALAHAETRRICENVKSGSLVNVKGLRTAVKFTGKECAACGLGQFRAG
jgi:hypothetical protein